MMMEMEFYNYLFEGVLFYILRMFLRNVMEEEFVKMSFFVVESVKLLRDVDVEFILYGCMSGLFIGGKDYEKEFEVKIEDEVKVLVISMSIVVIEVFKIFDV